jgi:NAD(P)-dependent dehydrogenase (short-subunit alcohol dehydrogenase family)
MEMKGKKIIVTGGASGIGKELVTQLLKEGALVSAVDINQDNLTKLTDELKNANLKTYVADISNKGVIWKHLKILICKIMNMLIS